MERTCILLGKELSAANDSRAHVIPSALGGRLKPKGLLSVAANQILNDRIDAPLVRALAPIMALVGGSRDRGENEPVPLSTPSGETYLVNYGRPMELARHVYSETIDSRKVTVSVRGRSMKEVRTLLGRVKSKHPSVDIDAAVASASIQDGYLSEALYGELSFGPDPMFPAGFSAASTFAALHGQPGHSAFSTYIGSLPERRKRKTPELKVPMPPDTFFWLPEIPPVAKQDGLTHVIAYFGDPERKSALVYIEYFGLAGVAVRLPFAGDKVFTKTYCVDVLSGKERSLELSHDAFAQEWTPTHDLSGELDFLTPGLENIMKTTYERSRHGEIERIIREEWAGEMTDEKIARISNRVAEMMVASRMRRRPGRLES